MFFLSGWLGIVIGYSRPYIVHNIDLRSHQPGIDNSRMLHLNQFEVKQSTGI